MTLTPNKPETAQTTDTLQVSAADEYLNWKQYWYPITFLQDLPKNRPYSFSLYDEPLVLFRNQDGKLVCLNDRCPHRAAKLSDGQIIDGKIECLYHGWQFGTDGKCLHIPQLPTDAKIPANSCVQSYAVVERQGIVWMWAGKSKMAKVDSIPTVASVDRPEFFTRDMIRDLPYDQTDFIENVIDPAHVPISHDATRNGGNRENAQPLEMEVSETSLEGIRGKYRGMRKANTPWIKLDFIAPNLILYQFHIEQRKWSGGLALYSIPLGKNRCRVLSRSYHHQQNLSWINKLRPRWLDHLNTNKVLEQDLPLIVGQKAQVEQLQQSLKELYLPLKTSDTLVVEYRKWLDKYGTFLPFYQGYENSHNIDKQPVDIGTRLIRHTQLCSSCSQAYEVTKRVKQTLGGLAIALAALGLVLDHSWIQLLVVSASVLAVLLAVAADKVKTKFERSFTRN